MSRTPTLQSLPPDPSPLPSPLLFNQYSCCPQGMFQCPEYSATGRSYRLLGFPSWLVVGALIATARAAKEVGDLCSAKVGAARRGGAGEEFGGLVMSYRNVQFVFIQRKMKLSSSYSIILWVHDAALHSAPLPFLLLLLMVLCYACSLTRLSLWALAKDTHKQAAACPVQSQANICTKDCLIRFKLNCIKIWAKEGGEISNLGGFIIYYLSK